MWGAAPSPPRRVQAAVSRLLGFQDISIFRRRTVLYILYTSTLNNYDSIVVAVAKLFHPRFLQKAVISPTQFMRPIYFYFHPHWTQNLPIARFFSGKSKSTFDGWVIASSTRKSHASERTHPSGCGIHFIKIFVHHLLDIAFNWIISINLLLLKQLNFY